MLARQAERHWRRLNGSEVIVHVLEGKVFKDGLMAAGERRLTSPMADVTDLEQLRISRTDDYLVRASAGAPEELGLHPRHDLSNATRRCVEATIRQRSGKAYRESRPPPPRRPVTPPGDRIAGQAAPGPTYLRLRPEAASGWQTG